MDLKIKVAISVGVFLVIAVIVIPPSVLLTPRTAQFRAAFSKKCKAFPQTSQSCEHLLSTFERTYVGLDSCNFPVNAYDQLFVENAFTHSCAKTMFWSDTKGLVHAFTKKRNHFITLEDTLLGHIMDGLTWCSKKGSKETFIYSCQKCTINPVTSFWIKASAEFADYACGNASVMLNGQIQKPFDPTSYFGNIELKRLKHPRVQSLTVILVTKDNTCNSSAKCHPDIFSVDCSQESLQGLLKIMDPYITYICKTVTESRIQECIEKGITTEACWS